MRRGMQRLLADMKERSDIRDAYVDAMARQDRGIRTEDVVIGTGVLVETTEGQQVLLLLQ